MSCGSFWDGQWFQWDWPSEWAQYNIMVKELVPIVLSCEVWGRQLAGGWVLIECDNSSVVVAVNKHYARLLRSLWFFVAYFDIDVRCKHIAGVNNSTADHLSHGNLHSFFHLHPQNTHQSTPLPQPLLQILGARLDIAPIQAAVYCYYQNGLAMATQRCYNAGQQHHLHLCTQANLRSVPTSEDTLLLFAAHLTMSGLAHTSIKVSFSSIGNLHSSCSQHDAYHNTLTPCLEQILRGINPLVSHAIENLPHKW